MASVCGRRRQWTALIGPYWATNAPLCLGIILRRGLRLTRAN